MYARRFFWALAAAGPVLAEPALVPSVPANFPAEPPELAREMVTVSHFSIKRVRELVEAHPSVAKAAWDWGFGDWESALGAASHMGNREIANYLLDHGTPPTLFSATMLGQLDIVKAFVAAQPGVQRFPGPHSIPLVKHAEVGGIAAEPVLRYLESLGDAGAPASAPIGAGELKALTGLYMFGDAPNERIEIGVNKGQLLFTRTGTTARALIHLGERAFHPQGAEAVRIRFAGPSDRLVLTVHDPDLVLTAKRLPVTDVHEPGQL